MVKKRICSVILAILVSFSLLVPEGIAPSHAEEPAEENAGLFDNIQAAQNAEPFGKTKLRADVP